LESRWLISRQANNRTYIKTALHLNTHEFVSNVYEPLSQALTTSWSVADPTETQFQVFKSLDERKPQCSRCTCCPKKTV